MIAGSSPHAWGRFFPLDDLLAAYSVHPHMRGADFPLTRKQFRIIRFIPTCVGQITPLQVFKIIIFGSSPHAWGRYRRVYLDIDSHRFIPTCVGQISPLAQQLICYIRFIPTCVGQMEGKRHCRTWPRFIPTCVGQMSGFEKPR